MAKPILRHRVRRLNGEIHRLQAELDQCLRSFIKDCPIQPGAIVGITVQRSAGEQYEVVAIQPVVRPDGEIGFDLLCENPMEPRVRLRSDAVTQLRAAPADGGLPTWSRADLPAPVIPRGQ